MRTVSLLIPAACLAVWVGGCGPHVKPPDLPSGISTSSERPGVVEATRIDRVTRENGLVIEDLSVGTGPVCVPGDTVTVRYVGTLAATGVPFDDARNERLELPLPKLIAGWREGLPGMRVGGRRRLTIPAALGYGDRPVEQDGVVSIPPNSDLIFEIDLLGVTSPAARR